MVNKVVFIDSEVSLDGKVKDLGVIKNSQEFHMLNFQKLSEFLMGAEYVCGHNIIDHDLKYLRKYIEKAGISKFIDTLYLSPLLFPKSPYHSLLKDDKFNYEEENNPLNDAKKCENVLNDGIAKFEMLPKDLKNIYYGLLSKNEYFKDFFNLLEYSVDFEITADYIKKFFEDRVCNSSNIKALINKYPVELAYAISQIQVMEFDTASITPPWVLKKFPKVENILQMLRSKSCYKCEYCKNNLDVVKGLKRWFGYDEFRKFDGKPIQEQAANVAISGESLLAVFPTGGGKSITFQLPALMQGDSEKGLTVVISPLQSLQKDQIDNLEVKHGITRAVRIDGSLDPVERTKQIHIVESGHASLLYISPESLRSNSIEKLLLKRNVVRFVIDEAHCFSAWGQDFRTDYLYIADFIKNLQNIKDNGYVIPVSCFTATAKQEVVDDIVKYFKENLNIELNKIISSASRKNLEYKAIYLEDEKSKEEKLRELLHTYNCPTIIYVARTKRATQLSEKLNKDGFNCSCYHGRMDKKDVLKAKRILPKE